MSVFIGKGLSLVTDADAQTVSTVRDTLYPDRLQIQIGEDGASQILSSQLQGGVIGGLNDFSVNTLNPATHELGRLALNIADEVNQQHSLGLDLNGNPGADVFGQTDPEIFSDTTNVGNGVLRGRITDSQALQASDYELRFDGAGFTATRTSDGNTTTGTLPMSLDGMALTLSIWFLQTRPRMTSSMWAPEPYCKPA